MAKPTLHFVGSGDAFGSGGRLQTCLCLSGGGPTVLIDCGASSLIGLKRDGIDSNEIDLVALTHLHGDHFGGLPFLILDGQFRHRSQGLVICGPPGTEGRVRATMEVMFPGSTGVSRSFSLRYVELLARVPMNFGPATITGYPVVHASGAIPFALRLEYGGRTIAYSGDTEWCEGLVDCAAGADIFVCEAYHHDKSVRYHLDYATLSRFRDRLACPRIVLTHMSQSMLEQSLELDAGLELAHDGLTLAL
jgi:ribonuclease BN (tRNA processing enzyme)